MQTGILFRAFVVLLFTLVYQAGAATAADAQQVQFSDKKLWVWRPGGVAPAVTPISLPQGIIVQTNGVFRVNQGKPRQLAEGDTLNSEGMLVRRDGSITPVIDHVARNQGRVLLYRDGDAAEVQTSIRLADGTEVAPDGRITRPDGSVRRLLDGELLQLHGASLPARDTVTVRGGQVIVQKDGSQILLGAGRTIMMNDGTKVFSDGTVVHFDGQTRKLSEGDILVIEGVVQRERTGSGSSVQ